MYIVGVVYVLMYMFMLSHQYSGRSVQLGSWMYGLLPECQRGKDHAPSYGYTDRHPIIGDNEQGQCPFPQEGSQVKDEAGHVPQSVVVQLLIQLL